MTEWFDTKFTDVHSVAYVAEPNPEWANLMDCGDYPCTAPSNILYSFKRSTFSGYKPNWAASEFQIIANNSGFAPYIEGCKPQPIMNAYVCYSDKMGVLLFESEDADNMDRSMQPIYVKR
jgi:hypothetical protein